MQQPSDDTTKTDGILLANLKHNEGFEYIGEEVVLCNLQS